MGAAYRQQSGTKANKTIGQYTVAGGKQNRPQKVKVDFPGKKVHLPSEKSSIQKALLKVTSSSLNMLITYKIIKAKLSSVITYKFILFVSLVQIA